MRKQATRLNGKYSKIETWDSPTGASLCIYHKKPSKKALGIIHINHGLADHAGRYARFAAQLTKAGFIVYAQDHRGHGATTAPDAAQGVFADTNGWEKVLQDIKFVNSEIRKKHPDLPLIMFGHSMGAMLTYNYILRWSDSVDGAAIWNAAMSKSPLHGILKFILSVEKLTKGPKAVSILTKMTFDDFNKKVKPHHTSADWLTKDVTEAKAYEDDPDCGWSASVSMWQELTKGITIGSRDIGLESIPKALPIYLLGGEEDPSVNFGKAILDMDERFKKAGLTHVKTVLRAHGRHEALNEPKAERGTVMHDFIDWAKTSI
jgi:alpha-beta hydrolase superfamily lysophospholipase